MPFDPSTYVVSSRPDLLDIWRQADQQDGGAITVHSEKEAWNLRMELYRARRALEVQAKEQYYRDIKITVDQNGTGKWRVKLIKRPTYTLEPLVE